MTAKLISTTQDNIIVQVIIPLSKKMIEGEDIIQNALNDVGVLATGELLKRFDTDGSPIVFGKIKMTSKGKVTKEYQTPYGVCEVSRHVYQSAKGGSTFCPLDQNARIIVSSTPRFAKQISHKFAEGASTQVQKDLAANHNRTVARSFLQNVADAVGAVALLKEEAWEYTPKVENSEVKTIAIGLDGTCMLLCQDGYRQTMVGTLSFYDKAGDRLHTTYIASAPEYGKETFKEHLTREIERAKERFPKVHYLGVADGAKENWDFLKPHTNDQILDFWHASEYLTKVADAIYPKDKDMRSQWLEDRCHRLKHNHGAASRILNEMKEFKKLKLTVLARENLNAAISYFKNNHKERRMNYAAHIEQNHCIGSGVTEAACKVIVKQRLCKSGMKWKEKGAAIILSLRSLVYSGNHWDQFWEKIDQYGLPMAA
jgi:hypothetical protein